MDVGDRVAFKRSFLRNTGQMTGDVPFARGTITKLVPLGQTALAEIKWDSGDVPAKANIANLVLESSLRFEPA